MKALLIALTIAALAVPVFTIAASLGQPEVTACVKFVKSNVTEAPTLPVILDCFQHYSR